MELIEFDCVGDQLFKIYELMKYDYRLGYDD